MPSAVEAWNLNHWTAREVPGPLKFNVERKTLLKQGHNLDIMEQCSGGEELWDRYLKVQKKKNRMGFESYLPAHPVFLMCVLSFQSFER